MYSEFFKLRANPFSETPETKFFFKAASHVRAIDTLMTSIKSGKGFTAVTGEVGVGKTIVSRLMLNYLAKLTPTALILNPVVNQHELLRAIRGEFRLSRPADGSFQSEHDELAKFLLSTAKAGKRSVLIIDEAQRLTFEGFECVRLLSNLETESKKLLQIILVGQPELKDKLESFDLRQLNQRISSRAVIDPLGESETEFYIKHRIEIAGGANFVRFESDAVKAITKASGGVPRLINQYCEKSLEIAGQMNKRLIDAKMVKQALAGPSMSLWRLPFPKGPQV